MRFHFFFRVFSVLAITTFCGVAFSAEEWKSAPYNEQFTVSGMSGVGIIDGRAGLGINGSAAVKIAHLGFFPDMTNQVYVEVTPGALFIDNSTAFTYSMHLRWDFHKNESWSLYALGGFGGLFTGANLGSRAEFYPRYGIGAMWHLFDKFSFRGEISHEFTGLGIMTQF